MPSQPSHRCVVEVSVLTMNNAAGTTELHVTKADSVANLPIKTR